jgi:cytochrome c556
MNKPLLLCAAMLLATAGLARADVNPIEVRQTGLDLLAADFAGIRAVVAAKGDVKTLENPAKAMQRWAAVMPSLFPKGSETGGNTKALPEIWSDMAGFQKAAADLGVEAGKLAVAAKAGDADAVAALVKPIGDACGACHKTYRAK